MWILEDIGVVAEIVTAIGTIMLVWIALDVKNRLVKLNGNISTKSIVTGTLTVKGSNGTEK